MNDRLNEIGYIKLLRHVLTFGEARQDRTGVGTRSVFGERLEFNLRNGFPLLTTRFISLKVTVAELLWFIQGRTDAAYLHQHGVRIWDPWVKPDGTIGPGYGKQLRDCGGVDQLSELLHGLKNNPHGRRHVISLWHPPDLHEMALPPCHGVVVQFYVTNSGGLSCQMYQRSADLVLGVPTNIASYALLTQLVAREVGLTPDTLHITFGDTHIYNNHVTQVQEQISRPVRPSPSLVLLPSAAGKNIFELEPEMFKVNDYKPHPAIKAPIAV